MTEDQIYALLEHKLDKIVTDSRQIKEGDIFFALKGPNFNGNQFAIQAIEKGAQFAVVDELPMDASDQIITVQNALICLQNLSKLHRKKMNPFVIGITGSNGKTTTKELLYSILSRYDETIATIGNLNNQIGVPLTLLKLKPHHKYIILEMGANKPGDIAELSSIADPDLGLITSLGKAHLEGFGSFENLVATKFELFDYVDRKNGYLFYNMNDIHIKGQYQAKGNHITFSDTGFDSHFEYTLLKSHPTLRFSQTKPMINENFESSLFGHHNYQNAIAAISISEHLGVPVSMIVAGISDYIPSNMRSQILQWRGNLVILDAYNANPASMKHALESLCMFDQNPKWAILGKMAELGAESTFEHEQILQHALSSDIEKIVCIGEEWPVKKDGKLLYFGNVNEAKKEIQTMNLKAKTILIKGSRSATLEKLLQD
ncbi:MAG: UDP-N-acetylmuramoyl-tripeptide--D-alanyl-D-alanine ligase [Saprospiraceae bacterium]|nr:UDP-N-acetylmuramoyl-tripeptide--D-alanyl-D-alanine ligase [Saprospiraceae bacterium]